MKRSILLLAASALAGAAPARAQEAAPAPQAAPADGPGLAEIVVTAQRRAENLQRAAVPVSAVSGAGLVNAGVSDVANLTKLVPALVVQPQGGSSINFYIRGVGTYGTNAFAENAIAFNFAGVYVARPTSPVGTLFDLERIEVVKGPQGTLYGRNATGGAINALPRSPEMGRIGVDLTGELTNYSGRKLTGAVNLPLGDRFALRVAGQVVDRGGYLSDGYDDEKGQTARVSLLFKPDGAVSALLIGDYFHQGGRGVGSVLVRDALVPTAPDAGDRIGGSDPRSVGELRLRFPALVNSGLALTPRRDGSIDSRFYGATLDVEADLGFATLSLIPAYRRSEPDFLTYNNGYQARVAERDDQESVELRLASSAAGRLRYVLGGYYFHERQLAQDLFSQGLSATTIFNPRLTTDSKALFGQATYALSNGLRLVGGVRYTAEQKSQETPLRSLSPANPNPPFSTVAGDLSFHRVTWKAGAEWDVAPRSLLYANVATGFKAGGFFVAAIGNTFRPERLTAYTIGSKNRLFDNRVQLNLEAFLWNYRDQQVNFVGPAQYAPGVYAPGGITVNAGNARLYGVDADLQVRLDAYDQLGAELQYLHSNYRSFTYTAYSASGAAVRSACAVTPSATLTVTAPARLFAVDCAGRPAINAPRWTANLSYEHRFVLGRGLELLLGARSRIESGRYLAIDYLPEERQRAYRMSDLYVTLRGARSRWALTGFVNNVEDRTVLASAALRPVIPVVYAALRPPRVGGARLSIQY